MEFTVVILSEQVGSYPKINWTEWKDRNRKQMKSQGDVWSMATLVWSHNLGLFGQQQDRPAPPCAVETC